jgi:hypothetical protein
MEIEDCHDQGSGAQYGFAGNRPGDSGPRRRGSLR